MNLVIVHDSRAAGEKDHRIMVEVTEEDLAREMEETKQERIEGAI